MKKKKNIGNIMVWVIFAIIVFPFVVGIKYSVPEADDFTFARHLVENRLIYGNDIKASWAFAKDFYFTWQGTYFSNFTPIFFSPFLRAGIAGYHAELLVLLLIFVAAIIYFALSFVKGISVEYEQRDVAIIAILLFVFATACADLSEVFYWHCGALVYLLPISLGILSCTYVWKQHNKKPVVSWIETCLFALFAFLSVGGTLTVSAAVSGFMVLIVAIKYIEQKKIDKTIVIACAAIIGSFINALAPGNFVRQSGEAGDASLINAVLDSFDYLLDRYYELAKNGSIIIIAAVILLVLWKKIDVEKHQFKYPVIVTIWAVLVTFLGIFPVMYGHKSDYVADRSEFAETIILIFVTVFVSLYWMGWIKKNRKIDDINAIFRGTVILLIVMICIFGNTYSTDDYNIIKITRNYRAGNLQEYFQANMNLLAEVEYADTPNVVIEFYEPDNMGIYDDMSLSDNPANWINDAIARYYGKETLSVIYCDPE